MKNNPIRRVLWQGRWCKYGSHQQNYFMLMIKYIPLYYIVCHMKIYIITHAERLHTVYWHCNKLHFRTRIFTGTHGPSIDSGTWESINKMVHFLSFFSFERRKQMNQGLQVELEFLTRMKINESTLCVRFSHICSTYTLKLSTYNVAVVGWLVLWCTRIGYRATFTSAISYRASPTIFVLPAWCTNDGFS